MQPNFFDHEARLVRAVGKVRADGSSGLVNIVCNMR